MNTPAPHHNDGLEWLREVRSRMLMQAGGDFTKHGDRYRAVESRHPEKIFDPYAAMVDAAKTQSGSQP